MSHLESLLPGQQHRYEGLPVLDEQTLHRRRERVFLVFAGLFLGTLAMLNILGITKFIPLLSHSEAAGWQWGTWGTVSFAVAVGVLPYPVTFLCTDFISELFGRRRANAVVWVGLLLNVWVLAILWLGTELPVKPEFVSYGFDALGREVIGPPIPEPVVDSSGTFVRFEDNWTLYRIRQLTFGAVVASMIAYLAAQLVDVQLFHFWKRMTNGRHLWLRNNGSTLVSQFVDTFAVITITHFFARGLPIDGDRAIWPQLAMFIATGYVFKLVAALVDTVPFYLGCHWLTRYLRLPPAHGPVAHATGAGVESGVG
ncbi:MAG: VUT family protein [Planctomycetota bacterium]|nr:MAG: VUT family protein [Planctomycetota bacterium]